jgi:N-acetylglucosaminyldiphosphoundecaprenol N-acetyl-beta-D-mannosaminyltransferase
VKRVDVLGTQVVAAPLVEVCDELERSIKTERRAYVCLANVHVVETARRNPELAQSLGEAAMVLPDGAPIAWVAGRRLGMPVRRLAGPDLFEELCRRSPSAGYRHFFFGSTPETLAALTSCVSERHPGIRIAGSISPPFSPRVEPRRDSIDEINAARPDIVWVGLGAPKQECWMRLARPDLHAPLLIGVGAAFDFASGKKTRAPRLLRAMGLEWAYRLAHEPRRLGRRYLVTNTTFTLELLRSLVAR